MISLSTDSPANSSLQYTFRARFFHDSHLQILSSRKVSSTFSLHPEICSAESAFPPFFSEKNHIRETERGEEEEKEEEEMFSVEVKKSKQLRKERNEERNPDGNSKGEKRKREDVDSSSTDIDTPEIPKEEEAAKRIKLRVKSQDGSFLTYRIKYKDKLWRLMEDYCQTTSSVSGTIVFLFDGNRIRPNQTPEELGLRDEDEIDAMKQQTGGSRAICL